MRIKFNGLPIRRFVMFVILMGLYAIAYKYIAPYMNPDCEVYVPVHGPLRVLYGFISMVILALGITILIVIIGIAGYAIPAIPKGLFIVMEHVFGIEISVKWYDKFLPKWKETWGDLTFSIIGFIMFME